MLSAEPDKAPDLETPSSWQQVGSSTVAYLDPLTSTASTAALLSAFGEMKVTGPARPRWAR